MTRILSTAYWPNLLYFSKVFNADEVLIEQHENYVKQSFRNRTEILTSNGVLSLTIPVIHNATKEQTREILINYAEKWQHRHWGAITSAYRNSPYFEFFEDEIKRFYTGRCEHLLDYNLQQLVSLKKILKTSFDYKLTEDYQKEYPEKEDLRGMIHPKKENVLSEDLQVPYYQTFGHKYGFIPNLSILDLLFNNGLGALDYLRAPDPLNL